MKIKLTNSILGSKYISIFILALLMFVFSSCEKKTVNESKPLYELQKSGSIPKFDSDNAYNQIKAQVDFGPRNPGSEGHKKTLYYIQNELKRYADEVSLQSFVYPGYDGAKLELTNIIARFNPQSRHRIIFCAHWDTRPRAEHAVDPKKRNQPILGANDGASGCGVLLEIARMLKSKRVNFGIDLVFFDGEDYGKENDLNNFCLGSKYFAANYPFKINPAFTVLLDLVGDKQATFAEEAYSLQYAPNVVNMIWGIAARQNSSVFSQTEGPAIYDDHIPLNQGGLTAVDIIDADLVGAHSAIKRRNYWHSEHDTMDNIGKPTLQQLGDVLTELIYSLKFNS